jgi:hypothetical protein
MLFLHMTELTAEFSYMLLFHYSKIYMKILHLEFSPSSWLEMLLDSGDRFRARHAVFKINSEGQSGYCFASVIRPEGGHQ